MDIESNLDFAQARYYAKHLGRFNSADDPFLDQDELVPQTWNLYIYVRNNPLNLVDPTGQAANDPAKCPKDKECIYDEKGKVIGIEDEEPVKVKTVELARLRGGNLARGIQNILQWFKHWFGRKPTATRNPPPKSVSPIPNGASPDGPSPRPVTIRIDPRQLQKKFNDHAKDFGVQGNWNAQTGQQFQQAIQNHLTNPGTRVIPGMYRHTKPVVHFYNPQTRLNVMTDLNGNFISGWRLRPAQAHNVVTRGSL